MGSAISNCAYDEQCSGVYHTCCTENCDWEWKFNGDKKASIRFWGDLEMPRLQICPMQSIKNASNDRYKKYELCTYQKQSPTSKMNTFVSLRFSDCQTLRLIGNNINLSK